MTITPDQFVEAVAEALGLDAEGVEDAVSWPMQNLLPEVHQARIDAARWRALSPWLRVRPAAGCTTHVEAFLPGFARPNDPIEGVADRLVNEATKRAGGER